MWPIDRLRLPGRPNDSLSIRAYLVLLAVVTVTPLALFACMLVLNQERSESAARERALRETARALALAVDEHLAGALGTVRALAASPALHAVTSPDHLRAEIAFATLSHPGWRSAALFTPSGELLMTTAADAVDLGVAAAPLVSRVLETGAPAISPLLAGVPGARPEFAAAAPVDRGAEGRHVLLASMDTEGLDRILERQSIPGAWQASIVDQAGTYAARAAGAERVGQRSTLLGRFGLAPGWHRGPDASGESVYLAYERAPSSGWGVAITVPTHVLDGPFRESLLAMTGAGVLCLAIGMAVAAVLGRELAGPLRSLTGAAARLEHGRPAMIPTDCVVDEIAVLARALQQASDSMEERARVRRELDAATRESHAWHAALAALAPVGLIRTDASGRATFVNERWTQITGLGLRDAKENRWIEALDPEEREGLVAEWRQALAAGREVAGEFRYRHPVPHVGERWLSLYARPVTGWEGEVIEYIGVVLDITDRKRGDEERAELMRGAETARAEAEAANRAKDDFLATLSHELRTPLNAILLWVEVLRESPADADMYRRAVESVERSARQQAQLVDDLLDVARLTSGKFTIDPRMIDLVGVVRSAVDSVRDASARKGVALELAVDAEACLVRGDPQRLQQVVLNLLGNALRFTPGGGRIDVDVQCGAEAAAVTVRDTGEGISPEFLVHIFERFRQADSSAGRRHGGLGLGLAIARDIVELHGGHIQGASEGKGRGATFSMTLPTSRAGGDPDASAPGPAVSAGQGAPHLEGLKVLLVEDDEDTRELMTRSLGQRGAKVVAVLSAAEALERLPRFHPHVIVSDIGMAGMDGYELIQRVRRLAAGAKVPAIALTGYASGTDRERALTAGFEAHLAKPVDPAELARLIAELAARV